MKTVAVTGVSGYIGNALVRRLEQHEDVDGIIGIGLKKPRSACAKLRFYSRDIREPFSDILVDKVDNKEFNTNNRSFGKTLVYTQHRSKEESAKNFNSRRWRLLTPPHVTILSLHLACTPIPG